MIVADVNRDHRPDIAVVNTLSNSVTVWFGNPAFPNDDDARIFAGRRDFAVGNSPRDLEAIDANGDGIVELAVSSFAGNQVIVINGFEFIDAAAPRVVMATATNPRAMAVADFDEDGRPDILVANQGNGMVRLFVNGSPFDGRP